MLVVGLVAVAAQAGAVHYSFDQTTETTWNVSVTVTGDDTAGLSAYGFYVNIDPTLVSYAENTLSAMNSSYQTVGITPGNLVAGDVGGKFNAGNYQGTGAYALLNIGLVPVQVISPIPALPSVDLGVPALLGTLTTPAGLGAADFCNDSKSGLFNLEADGFLADVTTTYEVNPIPEPMTMSLIGLGGLALIRRRK